MGHVGNERGLTVLELVMSATILSIALLPVLRLCFGGLQSVTDAWTDTRALASAQQLMGDIQEMNWDETGPAGGAATVPSASLGPDAGDVVKDDIDDWDGYTDEDPVNRQKQRRSRLRRRQIHHHQHHHRLC